MRFQVHTVYDSETVRELQNTIQENIPAARTRTVRRNLLLGGAACLAGAALLAIVFDNSLMAIVPLICGIILVSTGASFHSTLAARREKEARKDVPVSETDVFLEEDSFQVLNQKGAAAYAYAGCTALLENQRHFILMLGNQHAVALDKEGIQGGTAEALRAFLQEKTGTP